MALIFFLILASNSAFSHAKPGCPLDLVPGKSIGPLMIGMRRADAEKFDLLKESAGRAAAYYDAKGSLEFIDLTISKAPDCLQFDGKPLRSKDFRTWPKLFSGCETARGEDATYTRCKGVELTQSPDGNFLRLTGPENLTALRNARVPIKVRNALDSKFPN